MTYTPAPQRDRSRAPRRHMVGLAALVATLISLLIVPSTALSAPVTAVTFAASSTKIEYKSDLTFSGQMTPKAMNVPVEIEYWNGTAWRLYDTTTTAAYGKYKLTVDAMLTGGYRARVTHDGGEVVSPTVRVEVIPIIRIARVDPGLPFVGARVRGTVFPTTYKARINVNVSQSGRRLDSQEFVVSDGKIDIMVPTPGVGQFRADLEFPTRYALSGTDVVASVRSQSRNLSEGSSGPEVRAMNIRLRELGFLTKDLSTNYTFATGEAVLAFRKFYGLDRLRTVNDQVWQLMARVTRPEPRRSSPSTHIEVDKTRQTMSVVQGGVITGIIHVSTGASGNTPVGEFQIYQMGGSYLYKFMAFKGDFGIHGYDPVPAWPASHGCVREPFWAALWVWNRSFMGETVYVFA